MAEGRTEGRKAENYAPPLFFEKAGDKKLEKGRVWFMAQGSWSDVPHPAFTRKSKVSEYACLLQRAKG